MDDYQKNLEDRLDELEDILSNYNDLKAQFAKLNDILMFFIDYESQNIIDNANGVVTSYAQAPPGMDEVKYAVTLAKQKMRRLEKFLQELRSPQSIYRPNGYCEVRDTFIKSIEEYWKD